MRISRISIFKKKKSDNEFGSIELRIGYIFNDKKILQEALTHKSLENFPNYERLEFLGDSLLNIIITEWLYKKYPNYNEGLLTKRRAELVNKIFLYNIASKIFLKEDIFIGNSIQKKNNKIMMNILSDVIESIIGAIFIDGGIQNAEKFIYNHLLTNLNKSKILNKNYKGKLIELCHMFGYSEPIFKLTKIKMNNQIKFKAKLNINNISCIGIGSTKKNAEVNAAKTALDKINSN